MGRYEKEKLMWTALLDDVTALIEPLGLESELTNTLGFKFLNIGKWSYLVKKENESQHQFRSVVTTILPDTAYTVTHKVIKREFNNERQVEC